MRVSDFNYELPEINIAQFPPAERGTTKLLVVNRRTDDIEHRRYFNLVDYIEPGDVVVLNDTKVIKARLTATNLAGQARELLLLERHADETDSHRHRALYRGKLHEHETLQVHKVAVKVSKLLDGGVAEIESEANLLLLSEQFGTVPLPPYMKRDATPEDIRRYQTEFASKAGSVAAPTASLNFTNNLRTQIGAKGGVVATLTLHVGLGTFLPIRTDDIEAHDMHSEYFEIPAATMAAIQRAKATGRKIFAVGTTVTRTLEFAAQDILQPEPRDIHGEANIFIYPGYRFKVVDALLTNFHAPKSTVLMMAAAFAGWDRLKRAYEEALQSDYQFLSYGDSMLIL